ncbi:uncharacterized protein UV8b_08078 [Ustilaginoidea virens]|uniref:Uncharacterized protein n=1 Tax=Ustilaginoidea virens TaxID=1159556 RepID=A0A8E5ML35_USTVR|nr:uncharacterized protein UV8b_08078 [Ustilaginoidea virens]QUC23837.1 hypothetical protein UV8b_08078 [Ustilaginoidea virens]
MTDSIINLHSTRESMASPAEPFTPAMRDRQARGKNPYKLTSRTESFQDRERRDFALSVLDSPEQLMMYALSAGDSVPGQRVRFMRMLCGFEG